MPAEKLPAATDVIGTSALAAGVGMLFAQYAQSVPEVHLRGILISLTPVVTVSVNGLYFVYAILIDLAIGAFVRWEAGKRLKKAKERNASAEHINTLEEIVNKYEEASLQDLADSYREWRKARK